MPNLWFQRLKCDDLPLLCGMYLYKLDICGGWTVQNKVMLVAR